jgi:hypothetical protein
MAKIIVEQVQGGSGGTALTVPTAAATVNNQAVVGSTAGVLSHSPIALPAAASGAANRPLVGATSGATSFSPLALPAADGAANRPVTTNGSGQLQFGAVGMPAADGAANKPLTTNGSGQLQFGATAYPAADGTANQVLQTNGSGVGSWGTISSSPVPDDNDLIVGCIFTSSQRENIYSTGEWSSSGPNSTYYNSLSDANSILQAWNMLLGDGKPQATGYTNSTNDITYSNNSDDTVGARVKLFAHNRRLGYVTKQWEHDDNLTGNYAGCTWSALPVRNKGSSDVNIVVKRGFTSRSNYSGSGLVSYRATYSSGTNYANATGGAWTTHNSHTSDTSYAGSNSTSTVTVPAGETIILMMTSHHRYHTTDMFHDIHVYGELHTMFTHADIQCDLRMLEALHTCRQPAANYNTNTPYELYTSCATCYGDR